MAAISLNPATSGYNLANINANFVIVQDAINNHVLNVDGGGNTMLQDLDMNSYRLMNVANGVNDGDVVTVGQIASLVNTSLANLSLGTAAYQDVSYFATPADLAGKYSKPGSGIPIGDLDSGVQASLGKADTAVQPASLGTAAALDVPTVGNASSSQVVIGSDTRLTGSSGVPVVLSVEGGDSASTGVDKIELAPATSISATPPYLGAIAVVGTVGYLAVGTSSAADWKQITN